MNVNAPREPSRSFIDHIVSTKQGPHGPLIVIIIVSLTLSVSCLSAHSIILQSATGQVSSSQNTTGTTKGEFLTYSNPAFGVRMQYPKDWSVREIGTNSSGNNTVAMFISPSKPSSELGNISGVSGHFVPYLDIFVFPSKNTSLSQIINGQINRFHNNSDLVLNQSKLITLKTNQSAYLLNYSATIGGAEHFKKIQVFAPVGNKVYVVTFTSQQDTFSNYMPLVQKMINTFGVVHNGLSTTVKSPSPLSKQTTPTTPSPKKAPTGQTTHTIIPLIPSQ
jgi:hypothetical protein